MVTHRFVAPDPFSPLRQGSDQGASATAAKTIDLAPPRLRLLRSATAPAAATGLDLTDRDRRLLAQATRYAGLVPSQAWRWEWPKSPTIRPAWNRLSELTRAGLLARIPMRRGEGVYVTTEQGARLVRDLTGGLSAPRMPDATDSRWLGQLRHDLTVPEVERWLLERARRKGHDGTRFLTGRQLARERAMALPSHLRRGSAPLGYMPDGELVLPTGERIAVEVELHDKAARLADKLAWYRDAGYAEVLWLVPAAGVERPLAAAIDRAGATDLMAIERLPEGLLYAA